MLPSIKLEGILCCINSRCLWVLIDLHNSAISLRKKLPSFFEYPPCVSTYLWIDPSIHPSRHQYVTYVLSICAFYLFMLPIHISVYIYIYVHIYIYMFWQKCERLSTGSVNSSHANAAISACANYDFLLSALTD
jgi:hypothetical protein